MAISFRSKMDRLVTICFVLYMFVCKCGSTEESEGTAYGSTEESEGTAYREWPSVLLSVNARNEEYTLPTFFGYIDNLYYPKHRMSIWIQTDHNEDNTSSIINQWVSRTRHLYHKVNVRNKVKPDRYKDTKGPCTYTTDRYIQLLKNLQRSVEEARAQWADYWFFVNVGNFLFERKVLYDMIMEEKTIIAPMLELFYEGGFSNFWAAADENGYYKSVPEYWQILERKMKGTFEVPMVHSTFLIDMRDTRVDSLQFYPIPTQYKGYVDDIIVFAWSVHKANLTMFVCNKKPYGFMMEQYKQTMSVKERHTAFTDVFVDYLSYNEPLPRSHHIDHEYPVANKRGFDEVFMINLVRRPERRRKMELSAKELGLEFRHYPAVDGLTFTKEKLIEMGISAMTEFRDPFLERPITFGEIGCFLSHHNIWKEMIEKGLEMVMVLEDDVRFESNFNVQLDEVMTEARNLLDEGVEWDFMYLGRKPLNDETTPEIGVYGTMRLCWAKYSYWTLGYVIRLSGAKKLVEGNPLLNMIPVDEYIPVKFNEHFNEDLLKHYYPRELIAFSAHPLLIFPTHYVGDPGHFSDTDETLSFQGEDVQHFKGIKLAEMAKKKQKEREDDEKEKMARRKEFEAKKESERLNARPANMGARPANMAADSASPVEGSILDDRRPREEL